MTHDAEGYEEYELRQHIYNIPDTYVGSTEKRERRERIIDTTNGKSKDWSFKTVQLDTPPAVVKCFMEITTNASDNAIKSISEGIDPGVIKVNVTSTKVVVENSGIVIPVKKRQSKKGEVYTPELIFGTLLTSSNYTGPRTGGGRNGYGAKLVNIFSMNFIVEVGDPINRKLYRQEWSKNMTERGDPEVSKYSRSSKPFVRVTYVLDFKRFDMQKYSSKEIGLFGRYCADIAYTCGIKIKFNKVLIKIDSIDSFAKRLFPKNPNRLHYTHEGVVRRKVKGSEMSAAEYNKFVADVCIVDSQSSRCYSYTNGMENPDGGVHQNAALDGFSKTICAMVNNSAIAKKSSSKITKRDVRGKVSIIVSVKVIDPSFEGQMKSKLNSPNMTIPMPSKLAAQVNDWKFMEIMTRTLGMRAINLSKKTDGRKTRFVDIPSAEDANKAGCKESHKCRLYVVEGLSATGYITHGLDIGDRNYVGIYPMRGKPLNATKASEDCYAENRVVGEIKRILGLREEMDYSIESNFRTLRYGKLIIAADADVDGTHIVALLVNIFNEKYKSLIKRGFVSILLTPIVKVTKGRKVIEFYSEEKYADWAKTSDAKGYKTTYYKGLGKFKPSDSKKHFKNPKEPRFVHDSKADSRLQLAFSSKKARERKTWIEQWQGKTINIGTDKIKVSKFIDSKLISYSSKSIRRSIPFYIDGLKDVQCRIIYACSKYWKTDTKVGMSKARPIAVCRIAASVAEMTKYVHGPTSLENAIVEMTNDYAGSNNMGYFVQEGSFGTRNGTIKGCGKDASRTRYCEVKPMQWWPYMYRKEDEPLLHDLFRYEDGKKTCPMYLLPILPMILINGSRGIATGWSTFIPCHNPLDIVEWIESRLKGEETKDVYPWYRGFTGEIQIVKRTDKAIARRDKERDAEQSGDLETVKEKGLEIKSSGDGEVLDVEPISFKDLSPTSKIAMRTVGRFDVDDRGKVTVTEIPIGTAFHNYSLWLKHLCVNEKSIKSYNNLSIANSPKFEIKGMKRPSMRKLKLYKSYGLGIMNCRDEHEKLINFRTSEDLLEKFYKFRLPLYGKRKDIIVTAKTEKLQFMDNRAKFIRLVALDKKIKVLDVSESSIYEKMEENGIRDCKNVYASVSISNCSKESLKKLLKSIEDLKSEIEVLRKTDPKDMWLKDISEFLVIYKKLYPDD